MRIHNDVIFSDIIPIDFKFISGALLLVDVVVDENCVVVEGVVGLVVVVLVVVVVNLLVVDEEVVGLVVVVWMVVVVILVEDVKVIIVEVVADTKFVVFFSVFRKHIEEGISSAEVKASLDWFIYAIVAHSLVI